MRINLLLAAVVVGTLVQPAGADSLHLKDGSVLKGTLVSADSKQVVFLPEEGEEKTFEFDQVARLDFERLKPRVDRPADGSMVVPAGTQIMVRTIDAIDGKTARAGARFSASLDDVVAVGSLVAFPKGADCQVEVVDVEQGRELALRLVSITSEGKVYRLSTEFAEVEASGRSRTSKSVRRGIGLGALGAGIGALAGGGKGAAIGAAIGGGAGAVSGAAAKGKQLNVAPESRLMFTLTAPVPVN